MLFNVKKDTSIWRGIGIALGFQFGNHIDHFQNVIGGFRIVLSYLHIQCFQICMKSRFKFICEFGEGNASFSTAADCIVIHISQVHSLIYFKTSKFKISAQQIFKDKSSIVANMCKIIHCGTTSVHLNYTSFKRLKCLFLTGDCIIKPNTHAANLAIFLQTEF